MMMTVERIVVAIYAAWFALSIARQPRWTVSRWIARWDVFGWFPSWRLFTLPTRYDFYFAVRFGYLNGTISDWEPLPIISPRPPGAWLWHPQFVRQKMAMDLANRAAMVRGIAGREEFQVSPRYRAFLDG